MRALARFLYWQARKRMGKQYMDVAYHGRILRIYADSQSGSAAWYFSGFQDYNETVFIRKYLRKGDGFLDVGANVGVYAILAAELVGETGRVYAYEPGIVASERLCENIAINSLTNVEVIRKALTDRSGSIKMDQSHGDCAASIVTNGESNQEISEVVECTTLDDDLPNIPFAMAKLDIEGAEPLALKGAKEHLRKSNPPVIQMEVGYSRRYGVELHDFLGELMELGYVSALYRAHKNELHFTQTPWTENIKDILVISQRKLDFVRGRIEGLSIS